MIGAITQRMDVVELGIQDLFTNLYCKKDFLYLLKIAKETKNSNQPFVIGKLVQMLNDAGKKCEYGKSLSYYEKIVLSLDIPADADEINQRIVNVLNNVYATYPQPGEFMQRIVDLLDPSTTGSGSLQLRILRRFMMTVNVKENKKYYSKTLAKKEICDVDESIFEALSNNSAEKCDYFPLVQAAFNLAKGVFVSPVTTKELLFLLAFAYDMRYYASKNIHNYILQRDVEKNLFEDYYCDNLTRYIYSEDGGKSGNSDKEPSGFGINPKNFIDVAFIYYLNMEGIEASQKVSRFYTMINKVKNTWKSNYTYIETQKSIYEDIPTGTYRNRIDTVISGLDEDAFEKYLLENYYCDLRYTYVNKKTGELQEGYKGLFELQIAINSAYTQYNAILDLIRDALYLPAHADFSKIDRRTIKDVADGESFDNMFSDENNIVIMRVSELEQNVPCSDLKYFRSIALEEKELSDFLLIMKNIEKRLNPYEAIGITDTMGVTRTKMIAAYYHFYCLENGLDDNKDVWKSFKDVYDDMSSCLNPYLEDAGYQKISSKNIYDVFVIFFAYCKINNFLS
ncbi:MAG: hypothetical protein J6S23_00655 [Clostridia bacterium]|nr:hypothetical protein [Clostridia bacterium]